MIIEQLYTKCLSQGAYFIESEGEVAIIDPLREVQQYIDMANEKNATIKYIFETHFHADFVSGHVTLAKKTGAKIIYGPMASTAYNFYNAKDYEEFKLGSATIVAIHTPGHTMESTCYLLKNENSKEIALFSGDTLFLGDVGRPDLAQKSVQLSQEDLAGMLYDSIRTKLYHLPNDILIYPAHGAGSACGKNLSKETVDTLGNQKKTNYALRENMTKEEFIQEVTDGLQPPPAYFPENVKLNKEGYNDIDEILKSVKRYSAKDFKELIANKQILVLDVRHQDEFEKGFIPSSIFIGLDGQFAPWVGSIILNIKQPIALITPVGREEEAITRLARVGYDNCVGVLDGGFETWQKEGFEVDNITSITAQELYNLNVETSNIYDVRKPSEYEAEHIENVANVPLDYFESKLDVFSKNEQIYIHCAGGYRSMIATSILKKFKIDNVVNILGGFSAIKKTPFKTTVFVCPSSIK